MKSKALTSRVPRILPDMRKHSTTGWSHYRLLIGQADPLKHRFRNLEQFFSELSSDFAKIGCMEEVA